MFAFDLAKELGWVNVDAMLASIPLPLFYEWMDYATRKPFGEERADLRIGYGLAKFASMWTKQGVKPSDFMPFGKGQKRAAQSPAQMSAILKGVVALHKGHATTLAKVNANRSKPSS